MIRTLQPDEVARKWREIEPYISRAISHGMGESTSLDMLKGVLNGQYECWEYSHLYEVKAYAMLRLNNYPQQTHLQIVTTAGEGFEGFGEAGLDMVERYAKDMGCSHVTIWGRKGWSRKLKEFGYEQVYSVCAKEL